MSIDLKQFCATEDEIRPGMHQPFGVGDFTYATDVRLMIRVPGKFKLNPEAPGEKAAELFIGFESNLPWIDVPEIPPPTVEKETCDYGFEHEVEYDDHPGLVIQNQILAKKYLRKIKSLPGVKIQIQKENLAPVKIKFDGGIGLLMPMRDKS